MLVPLRDVRLFSLIRNISTIGYYYAMAAPFAFVKASRY